MKKLFYFFLILAFMFFFVPITNILFFNEPDFLIAGSPKDYGVVFGAAIRPLGKLSQILQDRMDDAIDLYEQHKVKKLIFSGSQYNQIKPGEPKAMERYALKHGVKKSDIILDERGDRTYLTVQNVKYISELDRSKSFVFISSSYHMLRIRFLVLMMHVPHSYYYYTSKTTSIFNKEIIREIFAYWFYVFYRIGYSMR